MPSSGKPKAIDSLYWSFQYQITTCYSPTSGTTFLTDLSFFFLTSNHEILYKNSLMYLTPFTFSQTCVCHMANLMPSNLILFLAVHFHAVHGYAITHMHITHDHASFLLQFSSWVVLFSSSLPFVPHLLSQGPFPMLTIIIFLSWDPSHLPYVPSNPYTIPYYYWTGDILYLSLLSHGRLLLQPILSYLLCAPLTHPSFHDVPWCSILTQRNILFSSVMFFRLLSRSFLKYISPHICTYSTLLICTIHMLHLSCLESLAPRPDPPSPLVNPCHTRARQALDYLYKSTSYFEGLSALLPLLVSTSLHPTLKDSLLSFLDHWWCSRNIFHSATTMWSPHVAPILICLLQTVLIDLIQTCTYIMIVYKSQGINWHLQSDSLGVSPSKQTQ